MARRSTSSMLRGGRLWLLVGSMVVVGAATWLGSPHVERWQMRSRADDAFGALCGCLFGSDSPPDGERLRRTLIAAAAQGLTKSGDWPNRCDRHARELQLAVGWLESTRRSRCAGPECCLDDEACTALVRLRTMLDSARPTLREGRIDGEAWTSMVSQARAAGLHRAAATNATAPPAPARLHGPAAMRPLHTQPAELLTDPPGGTQLRLLFHDRRQRYRLCELDLDEPSPARCRDLPDRLSGGATGQLLAGAPGAPARLVAPGPPQGGPRWPHTVFDVQSGSVVAKLPDRPAGGFVWPDGTTAVLTSGREDGPSELAWAPPAPEGRPTAVPAPTVAAKLAAGPALLFDELLWAVRDSAGAIQLHASHLDRSAAAELTTRHLGGAGPLHGEIRFEPCHSADTLSVLVKGQPRGYSTDVALLFRTGGRWQDPVHQAVPSDWFGRTCYDDVNSLSWIDAQRERPLEPNGPPGSPIEGNYRVVRLRCTAQGCASQEVEVQLRRHSRASRYVVGDLGETMVLLWRSPLGDVRMRVAPLDELPQAPDVPLFDDERHGGFAWEEGRGAVFARARAAVVLVTAPADGGTAHYGLHIDGQGKVRPIDVASP